MHHILAVQLLHLFSTAPRCKAETCCTCSVQHLGAGRRPAAPVQYSTSVHGGDLLYLISTATRCKAETCCTCSVQHLGAARRPAAPDQYSTSVQDVDLLHLFSAAPRCRVAIKHAACSIAQTPTNLKTLALIILMTSDVNTGIINYQICCNYIHCM